MRYVVDHIPRTTPKNRRPRLPMTAETITIHNTGNPTSTARNERAWLTNPSNDRTASFHIVVDEKEAIECIPLNETAWHAGDGNGDGNRKSIGIEICESGDYERAVENAATLVADMLIERGWGVDRLRRHWDWSGKVCPRLMHNGGSWSGWIEFKKRVEFKVMNRRFVDVPKGHWAEASINKAAASGVMSGVTDKEFGLGQPVTREQLAVILDRIGALDK